MYVFIAYSFVSNMFYIVPLVSDYINDIRVNYMVIYYVDIATAAVDMQTSLLDFKIYYYILLFLQINNIHQTNHRLFLGEFHKESQEDK